MSRPFNFIGCDKLPARIKCHANTLRSSLSFCEALEREEGEREREREKKYLYFPQGNEEGTCRNALNERAVFVLGAPVDWTLSTVSNFHPISHPH